MSNENTICINVQFDVPFMQIKEFAERLGVSKTTVNNMINQGLVVTRKLKKLDEKTGTYKEGVKTAIFVDLPGTVIRLAKEQQ
ncbi:DNA-binding protein [Aggregatibacter aphrophilus]|nr:DNA-binding protein [Aggregatibacter aphrophilus]